MLYCGYLLLCLVMFVRKGQIQALVSTYLDVFKKRGVLSPRTYSQHESTVYHSILLPSSWAASLVRGSPLNWITGEKQHCNESVSTDTLPQAWDFGGVGGGQDVEGLGLLLIIVQMAPGNEGEGSRQCHPPSFPSCVPWLRLCIWGGKGAFPSCVF